MNVLQKGIYQLTHAFMVDCMSSLFTEHVCFTDRMFPEQLALLQPDELVRI